MQRPGLQNQTNCRPKVAFNSKKKFLMLSLKKRKNNFFNKNNFCSCLKEPITWCNPAKRNFYPMNICYIPLPDALVIFLHTPPSCHFYHMASYYLLTLFYFIIKLQTIYPIHTTFVFLSIYTILFYLVIRFWTPWLISVIYTIFLPLLRHGAFSNLLQPKEIFKSVRLITCSEIRVRSRERRKILTFQKGKKTQHGQEKSYAL